MTSPSDPSAATEPQKSDPPVPPLPPDQHIPPVMPLVLRSLTPAHWKAAGLYGALAFAGALAASVLTVLFLAVGVAVGVDELDAPENLTGAWFAGLFHYMNMGFLSPLAGNVSVESGFGDIDVEASVFFVPVIVPLATVFFVTFFGRRVTRGMALPHGSTRAVIAATAGGGFALVLALLAALIPMTFGAPEEGVFTLRALSVWGVILAAVVVFSASYRTLGPPRRSGVSPSASTSPSSVAAHVWSQGIRVAVVHLGGLALLLGVIAFIVVAVRAGDVRSGVLAGFPLLLPILAANGVAVGSMSMVMVDGSFGLTDETGAVADSLTMFSSALPMWGRIVLVLIVVFALLTAGVRWYSTHGFSLQRTSQWAMMPTIYGVAGLGVLAIGTMYYAMNVPMIGLEKAGIGPAPWTFLLIAILGAAVEACARYVAPHLIRVLPPGVVYVLTFRVNGPQATAYVVTTANAHSVDAGLTAPPAPPTLTETGAIDAGWAAHNESAWQSQTTQPGMLGVDTLPGGQPLSRKAKKAWAIGGISVVVLSVLLIAGTLTRNYLAENHFGPQQKVEAYLNALIDGQASDALAILDINVTNDNRVLLSDELYAAAENRPTEFRIDNVEYSEESATVTAQVKQDGKNYPVTFTLVAEGRQGVIFDDWRMTSGMEQNLFVFRATETLSVNGHDVNVPHMHDADVPLPEGVLGDSVGRYAAEGEQGYLPVLPGTYTFTAPKGTKYVTYGPDVTVTVTPRQQNVDDTYFAGDSDASELPIVSFQRGYTQAVVDDAVAQVTPLLDACLARNVIVPEGCEIASWENKYWDAMTDIERTWAKEPLLIVANELNGMWDIEQPDPSSLTGELSVFFFHGDIDLEYSARNEGDDDWDDGKTHQISPFFEHDGSQYSDELMLPITIDGDKLTVDTSKLNKQHDGWVK